MRCSRSRIPQVACESRVSFSGSDARQQHRCKVVLAHVSEDTSVGEEWSDSAIGIFVHAPLPEYITLNWEAPMALWRRGRHSEEYLEPRHPSG